jgi:hypothetical protein
VGAERLLPLPRVGVTFFVLGSSVMGYPTGILNGLVACLVLACGTSATAQLETHASISDSGEPQSLTVADFNGDGLLDLAIAAHVTGEISVLLGNGDGTFRKPVLYKANGASTVISGDLRNDGISDLVVTNPGGKSIGVFLGNGDGTFQPVALYPDAKKEPVFASFGDFNNDGNLDVVVVDAIGCYCIGVLEGNGNGTLGDEMHTPAPYPTQVLAVGDFNSDGNLDVVTAGQFGGTNLMGVLLGNGDGTFRTGASYAVYNGPQSLTVADFNGDGILDVAVAEPEGGAISVFLGNGDGTFRAAPTIGASFPGSVVSADINGDGIPDLVAVTSFNSNLISVFLGNGDGTFQPGMNFTAVVAGEIAVGDFNGDHKPDVAVGGYIGNSVLTLLNTGAVAFSPTTPLAFKNQKHGTTSAPQTVTLTNTGKTKLRISSMKASTQFGVTSTCGSSVDAGASCAISVTFSPKTQGAKSGTVTIYDSASSKPQVIELSGTGT